MIQYVTVITLLFGARAAPVEGSPACADEIKRMVDTAESAADFRSAEARSAGCDEGDARAQFYRIQILDHLKDFSSVHFFAQKYMDDVKGGRLTATDVAEAAAVERLLQSATDRTYPIRFRVTGADRGEDLEIRLTTAGGGACSSCQPLATPLIQSARSTFEVKVRLVPDTWDIAVKACGTNLPPQRVAVGATTAGEVIEIEAAHACEPIPPLKTETVVPSPSSAVQFRIKPRKLLARGVQLRLSPLKNPSLQARDTDLREGSERVENVPLGRWQALISSPGFEPQALEIDVTSSSNLEHAVRLRRDRAMKARIGVYATGGSLALVGVSALTIGARLLAGAWAGEESASWSCSGEPSCVEDQFSTRHLYTRMSTSAYVQKAGAGLLGVGVAAPITTFALLRVARTRDSKRAALTALGVGGALAAGATLWLGLSNRNIRAQIHDDCRLEDCIQYARPDSYQSEFRADLAQSAVASALLGAGIGVISSAVVELLVRSMHKRQAMSTLVSHARRKTKYP